MGHEKEGKKYMARTVGIGHQDFEKVRVKNNFYIDKTDFTLFLASQFGILSYFLKIHYNPLPHITNQGRNVRSVKNLYLKN